ncbi:MAG: aspartate-semialdehyde dehydrogenase [Gemmatimonadaceae bacterium]
MAGSPVTGERQRIPVAVLGATGAVGQTFVHLLRDHPWFRLAEVAASDRSVAKKYSEAARWLAGDIPDETAKLRVLRCDPGDVEASIVFSALDAEVAGEIELAFAKAGRTVFSNARNHRMAPDVPLLIPEINASHIALLTRQRQERGFPGAGALVTNANCAATVVAMSLAPLHQQFGVRQVFVTTMQAVSGAGYPGVPSLDILGNAIPYIGGEEEKIETETPKILGTLADGSVVPATIRVSAQANRVPVEHGHTACMTVALDNAATAMEAIRTLTDWRGAVHDLHLPSAPELPLVVLQAQDRPQPRRDVGTGSGMSVVVGRVRRDTVLDLRLVATGHNTIRGAAGGSILNAELLLARGLAGA